MNTDLQGNIYIANASDSLYSFSKDGQLNWKVNYGGGFFPNSVAISPNGNSLYISGKDSNIYALDLTGSIKWTYKSWGIRTPLLVDNLGNIFIIPGSLQRTLVSIDSMGNVNWEYVINNSNAFNIDSSPTMDYEGNIYYFYNCQIGTIDYGRIESVDYYGNYRWTYQFEEPDELIVMPLIVDKDGTVYCGSTWGYYFYAISNEGVLLWKMPLNGYQVDNSGAIGSDGTLYIGTHLSSITIGQEKTLIAIRDTVTSVGNGEEEVYNYKLEQNYPNPFNPSTIISWQSPVDDLVILKVFDVLGRQVITLVDEYREAGSYSIEFNASSLPSGIYLYRIQIGSYFETRKLTLLK
jgi:outer membrane protein assembly factor BamB